MPSRNGNSEPSVDSAAARIVELEAEIAGLLNMMVVMVRRDGGRSIVTAQQLADIENCTLSSHAEADGSVTLTVIRGAPRAMSDATGGGT